MIVLNAVPQVALDCLNKDHLDVANIINQLDEHLAQAPLASDKTSAIFQELVEHLEKHFACEEHQMAKYSFPALALHRREHQRVLDEVKQMQRKGFDDSKKLHVYLDKIFCPWLIDHIATLDTQTARYIVDAGGS